MVLGSDTTFNATNDNSQIRFTQGLSGTGNVSINGSGDVNTLVINNNLVQNRTQTNANSGSLSLLGFNGLITYQNIQNLFVTLPPPVIPPVVTTNNSNQTPMVLTTPLITDSIAAPLLPGSILDINAVLTPEGFDMNDLNDEENNNCDNSMGECLFETSPALNLTKLSAPSTFTIK